MQKKKKMNHICRGIIEWLFYIIGYGLILIAASVLFPKTMYIDNAYFGLWGFLASTIIFILNKTIKPVIVWLTLPITALSLGLFYPFINVFILHLVHFILGSHFTIHGLFMSAVVALSISIMNNILEHLVIKPLLGKERVYE